MRQIILLTIVSGLFCFMPEAHAQNSNCSNFWVNPKTGQQECFGANDSYIPQPRIVRDINGQNTSISTSKSPLKEVTHLIEPCSKGCFQGINDFYIAVQMVNQGSYVKKLYAIEYNLVLKQYNQVIHTGYVTNTDSSTLRPGEKAILMSSFSANVLPKGTKLEDIDVIFLSSPLDD
jgi:hypothetical protein